jgi:hypothetical protein
MPKVLAMSSRAPSSDISRIVQSITRMASAKTILPAFNTRRLGFFRLSSMAQEAGGGGQRRAQMIRNLLRAF